MMPFPVMLKSGVIPIERPVVPKAEQTSKIISMSSCCFSVKQRITTEMKHMPIAKIVIASDFKISS